MLREGTKPDNCGTYERVTGLTICLPAMETSAPD